MSRRSYKFASGLRCELSCCLGRRSPGTTVRYRKLLFFRLVLPACFYSLLQAYDDDDSKSQPKWWAIFVPFGYFTILPTNKPQNAPGFLFSGVHYGKKPWHHLLLGNSKIHSIFFLKIEKFCQNADRELGKQWRKWMVNGLVIRSEIKHNACNSWEIDGKGMILMAIVCWKIELWLLEWSNVQRPLSFIEFFVLCRIFRFLRHFMHEMLHWNWRKETKVCFFMNGS